jgi:hypothetical protein
MLKISDYAKALAIASLISTTLAIAPARADDGGLEDPPLQVASIPANSDGAYATYNCEEQRANAAFWREISRSDGGEMPDLTQVNCRTEVYAETKANAD